jgi:CLIP-associating protein 1/2
VDATQTPNVKVKLAALCYLAQLANAMDPTAIAGGGRDTKPALTKIITWTSDPKSADIRRASGAALNALFNLNVPAVTMMLSEMPSEYQVSENLIGITYLITFVSVLIIITRDHKMVPISIVYIDLGN